MNVVQFFFIKEKLAVTKPDIGHTLSRLLLINTRNQGSTLSR